MPSILRPCSGQGTKYSFSYFIVLQEFKPFEKPLIQSEKSCLMYVKSSYCVSAQTEIKVTHFLGTSAPDSFCQVASLTNLLSKLLFDAHTWDTKVSQNLNLFRADHRPSNRETHSFGMPTHHSPAHNLAS